MPVDFKNRLIFIHVPKNGGTAISSTLGMKYLGHHDIKFYKNILANFSNFKTLAVSRNPYDRLISCYEYAKMDESYWHSSLNSNKAVYGKHPDFEVCKSNKLEEIVFKNFVSKEINLLHPGWKSQHTYYCDKNFNLIVDDLINFDYLNDWFLKNYNAKIKKLNASKRKKRKIDEDLFCNLYGEECCKIVKEFYEKDIEIFKKLKGKT
jgi:hypothetical protein